MSLQAFFSGYPHRAGDASLLSWLLTHWTAVILILHAIRSSLSRVRDLKSKFRGATAITLSLIMIFRASYLFFIVIIYLNGSIEALEISCFQFQTFHPISSPLGGDIDSLKLRTRANSISLPIYFYLNLTFKFKRAKYAEVHYRHHEYWHIFIF